MKYATCSVLNQCLNLRPKCCRACGDLKHCVRHEMHGHHFSSNIFKFVFLYENFYLLIQISLQFVAMRSVNNKATMFQMMAWHCIHVYESLGLNELKTCLNIKWSENPLKKLLDLLETCLSWTMGLALDLRPRQNGHHFTDNTFKCIFVKENVRISIKISLKFVPKSRIDNIPALFQIMAWRRPGDKPLSEAMMVSLLTHMRRSASMS